MDGLNLNEDKNNILGVLDELNSFIGFTKCFTDNSKYTHILTVIQNNIFLIQAEIANPAHVLYEPERINQDHIRYIEIQNSVSEEELNEIDHFIIPEGTKFACALHCIRTISRRAERGIIRYGRTESGKDLLSTIDLYARYFDRVACLAFTLSRLDNKKNGYRERKPDYYLVETTQSKRRA